MENKESFSSARLAKEITGLFGYEFDDVRAGWLNIEPADMAVATIWYSARIIRDLPFPCRRTYFVQDLEAQFNPMGDGYLMAENSYRYGLHPITIGRWLTAMLFRDFAVSGSYFDFCAQLDVYRPLPGMQRERAICFIHQPEKPRRCAQIGIEALGIVKHHMPEVQIYLYGSRAESHAWFNHQNLGLLNLEACNALYNKCAVGLCISSTNPSRIPFEMMAAGLPVVEVHRDNTLYDLPDDATLLCEPTPESLAAGLMAILHDSARAERMSLAGQGFMAQRPIEAGLRQFQRAIEALLDGQALQTEPPPPLYRQAALVAPRQSAVTAGLPPGEAGIYDPGRLAFLPLPIRKVVRAIYHRGRRLLA